MRRRGPGAAGVPTGLHWLVAAVVALWPDAATAQRERERLGIAAEDDGWREPLSDGVHLSGAFRTRIELRDNATLLPQPERSDTYAYHRLLGAADVRHGPCAPTSRRGYGWSRG